MDGNRTRTAYGLMDRSMRKARRTVTGKNNMYLCKPTERSKKLGKALKVIKMEKKLSNEDLLCQLCGHGTISEIMNGFTGGTDEFFKLTMEHIGMTFGDLLRKAGLFDKIASVQTQEDEEQAQLPGQMSVEDVMEEPVTTQSEQIQKVVAEKQFTEAEKSYLVRMIRGALDNVIQRSAAHGTYPDPVMYSMMMHILEVLEQ